MDRIFITEIRKSQSQSQKHKVLSCEMKCSTTCKVEYARIQSFFNNNSYDWELKTGVNCETLDVPHIHHCILHRQPPQC